MPTEKIYYAILVLISAISILLTPFFYIRRPQHAQPKPIQQQWLLIIISNTIMVIIILALWYCYFKS